MQEQIRQAANLGFIMLTDGVNFDVAIYSACARYSIERDSQEFLAVRSRMAMDLYQW